ncbi:hypothetical protein NM208_g7754 [Fusarium decemcellulare]|uniref:Uncharacterized protein n=1 Tax=Fusarium decemcellulare TaxID=57161 RepID=A0ACC1S817_9HYPO|nr:hypothetical protein NM208_g7754 [Fusarium decemcellulare]
MVRFIVNSRTRPDGSSKEVPLLVIGAGLPRAATSSLQAAFEQLGFTPCLHMAEILPHADRLRFLLKAVREKDTKIRQKMVRQLIHGHQSICDLPVLYFTLDLMEMYPDVKIVLNGRPDPYVWAESASDSFWFFFSPWFKWTGLLWPADRVWYTVNMESKKWCKENLGTDDIFSGHLYNRYYDYVREEAQKRGKDILEFKAEDGWEPLCQYLGRDVPDTPFPRLNEKKVFKIAKIIIITRGLLCWLALALACWAFWKLVGPLF